MYIASPGFKFTSNSNSSLEHHIGSLTRVILYKKEFMRWYKLTAELNPLLRLFRRVEIKIPTLYLMGSEDYMFLPSIEKLAAAHRSAQLCVVPKSGHVVNVDQPEAFNSRSISFIEKFNR